MKIADECRTRALLFRELVKESSQFREKCTAMADAWLILAAIDDEFGADVKPGRDSIRLQ
jgi:hypothetical protein